MGWFIYKEKKGAGVVVHTCNPMYCGGRDQEDDASM
jgi:hypothetical protein